MRTGWHPRWPCSLSIKIDLMDRSHPPDRWPVLSSCHPTTPLSDDFGEYTLPESCAGRSLPVMVVCVDTVESFLTGLCLPKSASWARVLPAGPFNSASSPSTRLSIQRGCLCTFAHGIPCPVYRKRPVAALTPCERPASQRRVHNGRTQSPCLPCLRCTVAALPPFFDTRSIFWACPTFVTLLLDPLAPMESLRVDPDPFAGSFFSPLRRSPLIISVAVYRTHHSRRPDPGHVITLMH